LKEEGVLFCPRCGRPVGVDDAFCSSCGTALREPAPAPAGAWPAPAYGGAGAPAAEPAPVAWAPAAPPPPVAAAPEAVRYAGFWIRAFAYVIDVIVLLPVTWTIEKIMRVEPSTTITPEFVAAACFQAIAWLVYSALLESSDWQGTVGKLALGVRVTDLQDRQISILRATLRHLSKYLSLVLLGIGVLMIAFHGEKRGLHDLIARTRVIRRRRK
jgi:uncharacterized RDD family membrane protein YckC